MPTFGLVGEGPTDHIVLRNILAAYFGPGVFAQSVQPMPGSPGGWGRVLTWLRAGRHKEALQLPDHHLVIQIDSDDSNAYGVPHVEGVNKLTPEEIVGRVVERLKIEIGLEFYAAHARRFVFAVAVHEIECWILALHDDLDRHPGQTKRCLEAASSVLARKKLPELSKKGRGEQVAAPYQRAARDFSAPARLLAARARSASLDLFARQIDALTEPPAG